MRYDPEAILVSSGLEPLTVTSFLHENYVHFIEVRRGGEAGVTWSR